MRKVAAAILTMWVGVMLASPAGALGTSDPIETLEDVANGIDFVNSGSGSTDVEGPRGTAWTSATLVRVEAGDDVRLRVLDTLVRATTDHEHLELPKNFARGEASLASFAAPNAVAATFPEKPLYGESFSGQNDQTYCVEAMPTACLGEQLVQFPLNSLDGGTIDWDGVTRDAGGLLGLAGAVASELAGGAGSNEDGDLVIPLPTGNQPLTIGTGSLVDGLLSPAAIETGMHPSTGALARLESTVKSLVMLDGLSSFQEAGPGSQTVTIDGTAADAETKLLKIDQMTVLQTDALLELMGLQSSQLPDSTLAQLADALGIHTGRFATAVVGAGNWGSVQELRAAVADLQASVVDAVSAGAACDLIDDVIRGQKGFDPYERAADFGIERPDCLGLTTGALDRFVAAVNQLQSDLSAALVKSVGEEAILSITDLSASVKATASVTDDELMQGTGATGGIQQIRVGGVDSDLSVLDHADQWNETEERINGTLSDLLDTLGPQFRDVVRVRLMPRMVQTADVDGDYLHSRSAMTLMQVYIDLPSIEDVTAAAEVLLTDITEELPLGGGGGGGGGLLPLGRPDHGRADLGDPITISIGELVADANHTNPGRKLDLCPAGVKVCKSALNRTSWDPQSGWGPGSGDSSTNLPRTGGASGNLPIAVAGALVSVAVTFRRYLARTGEPTRGTCR